MKIDMTFNEIIKNESKYKILKDFISFRTLKGYPCPFCRDDRFSLEKEDDKGSGIGSDIWYTLIRIVCKTCRRVENYVTVETNFRTNEIVRIFCYRTVLQLNDDLYLDMDMETDKYTAYDHKHKFKLELTPFPINYLKLKELTEKIEIMATFS